MAYKIIEDVETEPVTLEEARTHLRIEPFGTPAVHPDDDYIEMLITSARQWCEEYTGKILATKTVEIAYDDFPENAIELPPSPVSSIVSVKYVDTSGAEQTVSSSLYAVDSYQLPNFLLLTYGNEWPETLGTPNNVKIRMVVGSTINMPIKSAILLLVGSLYENRSEDQMSATKFTFNSLPLGVYNLLQPYRINLGV